MKCIQYYLSRSVRLVVAFLLVTSCANTVYAAQVAPEAGRAEHFELPFRLPESSQAEQGDRENAERALERLSGMSFGDGNRKMRETFEGYYALQRYCWLQYARCEELEDAVLGLSTERDHYRNFSQHIMSEHRNLLLAGQAVTEHTIVETNGNNTLINQLREKNKQLTGGDAVACYAISFVLAYRFLADLSRVIAMESALLGLQRDTIYYEELENVKNEIRQGLYVLGTLCPCFLFGAVALFDFNAKN